jgi:hypothetical protein
MKEYQKVIFVHAFILSFNKKPEKMIGKSDAWLSRHVAPALNNNNNNNNKPVYEEGDVTVLWNQAVHTDREVTEK